jgi:hypothetical protein
MPHKFHAGESVIVRPRQAAYVGRQNSVNAALHVISSRSGVIPTIRAWRVVRLPPTPLVLPRQSEDGCAHPDRNPSQR